MRRHIDWKKEKVTNITLNNNDMKDPCDLRFAINVSAYTSSLQVYVQIIPE